MVLGRIFLSPVLALGMAGCFRSPKPVVMPSFPATAAPTEAAPSLPPYRGQVVIEADADLNPDANGRPSPVVIRIFQLKSDTGFGSAEYFALFDDDQRALAPDLIRRQEVIVAPGERRALAIEIDRTAQSIGVAGAFRDFRNLPWRAIVPARRQDIQVAVSRAGVKVNLAVGSMGAYVGGQ